MNPNPPISIIIPVYNVEKYLDACIDSVVSQTYKDLEVILVDDSSPDSSGRLSGGNITGCFVKTRCYDKLSDINR